MITNIYVYRWWLRFKIVLLKNSNYCLHIRFITSASNQFKYFTTSWFQSWSFIKKNLVSNKDSLQNQLKNFQADKCDSASARKAKDLIGDVTLEKARNVSKAASSLVAWVRKVFVLWLLFFFFLVANCRFFLLSNTTLEYFYRVNAPLIIIPNHF